MLENTLKGWHGAFSRLGKYSAEKYNVVLKKDKILNSSNQTNTKEIIRNFLHRNKYTNIYNDKDGLNLSNYSTNKELDAIEDKNDIFKTEKEANAKNNTAKKGNNSANNIQRSCYSACHRANPANYKYHNLHMKQGIKKKIYVEPTCTKYNPKKSFILKRVIVGPSWKTKQGRNMEIQYDMNDNRSRTTYMKHSEPLDTVVGKSFINMSKQTMRGNNCLIKDVRLTTTKKFNGVRLQKQKRPLSSSGSFSFRSFTHTRNKSINKRKRMQQYSFSNMLSASSRVTQKGKRIQSARPISVNTNHTSRPLTSTYRNTNSGKNILLSGFDYESEITEIGNINGNNKYSKLLIDTSFSSSSSEHNDSYEKYKQAYHKQFKKSKHNKHKFHYLHTSATSNNIHLKHKMKYNRTHSYTLKKQIKAPDFDLAISREYIDGLTNNKKHLIPFSLPNYKQVRERPIMMVVYDQKKHSHKKPKEIKGIEPSLFYDPHKMLDKVNNHHPIITPNFNMMSSRPDDDNPLPSYMKKYFYRANVHSITDQSLRMNNYSEGKFLSNCTSFWPKKSYNKIINLNLLNSKQFVEYALGEKTRKEMEKSNNYMAKSMKFYKKNYEELMKEGLLSKFDNVTYKTIKKDGGVGKKEMEKFLEEMNKEGNK